MSRPRLNRCMLVTRTVLRSNVDAMVLIIMLPFSKLMQSIIDRRPMWGSPARGTQEPGIRGECVGLCVRCWGEKFPLRRNLQLDSKNNSGLFGGHDMGGLKLFKLFADSSKASSTTAFSLMVLGVIAIALLYCTPQHMCSYKLRGEKGGGLCLH